MSETADLIAEMIKALQDYNAGMVNAGIGKYHIIVCTDEASKVIQEAYDKWAGRMEKNENESGSGN